MSTENKTYCVYQLRLDGEEKPFYIGAGSRNRPLAHFLDSMLFSKNQNAEKNKMILSSNKETFVEILYENLTREESFEYEMELIKQYGRLDIGTGCLTNKTDGGVGSSGRIYNVPLHLREQIRNNVRKFITNNPEFVKEAASKGGKAGSYTRWVLNRDESIKQVTEKSRENFHLVKDSLKAGYDEFLKDEDKVKNVMLRFLKSFQPLRIKGRRLKEPKNSS